MISFKKVPGIFLYRQPVDLRKGIDGYAALVSACGLDPCSGQLFLFTNRSENKMKGIIYDGVSFWLLYRRLNSGKIQWKRQGEDTIFITHVQLKRLLKGMNIDYAGNYRPSHPELS